jgi:superfamily II DNA or RNA helicase
MKAIISNKIYMIVDSALHKKLEKELTYKIPSYSDPDQFVTIKNLKVINFNIAGGNMLVAFPVGRTDLIPKGYTIEDKRSFNYIEDFPEIKFELRPSQKEIVDNAEDNCMINAKVGFGKTITALALASKLKQKTLVVVHTVALRNQWEKEIVKTLGIKPGVIGSGKFNIDSPVVVANVQTLVKYVPQISREFGLVVLDECLDYSSRITTRDGPMEIGKIVNNKLFPEVLSYNEDTGKLEWKKVLRHFKNKQEEDMIKFTFSNQSTLVCTMNHTIYSLNKGKIKAEHLLEGDWVKAHKSFKTSNVLNEKALPIILGMILGDGCLVENKTTSVRLALTQGQAQKDYLEYKRSIFSDAFKSEMREGKSGYKEENSVYGTSTLSFYDLQGLRKDLYGEGRSKNSISKRLADMLTEESWSLIYQDDGSLSVEDNSIIFSLCEMTDEAIQLLRESLAKVFGIQSVHYKCKRGFSYVRLNKEATQVFLKRIAHLVHPCMRYKLGAFDSYKEFQGIEPMNMFEEVTALEVKSVDFVRATGGYRYNIEVEDNHNYFSGGKLVSNCHHVSSPTFSKVIDAMFSRYKIGLSGTIERKDQKHVVFKDYFSSKIYKPPKENTMTPKVDVVHSGMHFSDYSSASWAEKVNVLMESRLYQNLVVALANKYSSEGHKVLIVSDRVEFLKECASASDGVAELLIGALKEDEREKIISNILEGRSNELWATQSLASEGLSINPLSCLILATPLNNIPLLEQLIGRVIREFPGKLQPVVVDVKLEGNTVTKQFNNRLGHYMKENYEITFIK